MDRVEMGDVRLVFFREKEREGREEGFNSNPREEPKWGRGPSIPWTKIKVETVIEGYTETRSGNGKTRSQRVDRTSIPFCQKPEPEKPENCG